MKKFDHIEITSILTFIWHLNLIWSKQMLRTYQHKIAVYNSNYNLI